jgi:hypothetical protein
MTCSSYSLFSNQDIAYFPPRSGLTVSVRTGLGVALRPRWWRQDPGCHGSSNLVVKTGLIVKLTPGFHALSYSGRGIRCVRSTRTYAQRT